MFRIKQLYVTAYRTCLYKDSWDVVFYKCEGIEVELGTPDANRSLSRNEVQIPFSEIKWPRVLRLMYIAQTVHQMH